MRKAFVSAVTNLMAEDEDVFLLLGDISVWAFREAFACWPDRCLNVGTCEQAMVGLAAGLAREGKYPIIHTIAPFVVERALEQIKLDLALPGHSALIVTVGASYDYAALGPTHHCPGDVQILLTVPGLDIWVPRNSASASNAIRRAAGSRTLAYVRLAESETDFNPRRWQQSDARALVLAVGPTMGPAAQAAHGMPVNFYTSERLRPLDCLGARGLLPYTHKMLVVEPFLQSTMASALAPHFCDAIVRYHGVAHQFATDHGTREEEDADHGLDAAGIRRALEQLLAA